MVFQFHYDSKHDILAIYKAGAVSEESVEISEDIVIDLDKDGQVNGIEVFYASEFFSVLNKQINKNFLEEIKSTELDFRYFRNSFFIVVKLSSEKQTIIQPLPPLRRTEYVSPLLA